MSDNNLSENGPENKSPKSDIPKEKSFITFEKAAQGNAGVAYNTTGNFETDPFISQDPPINSQNQTTNDNNKIDAQSNSEG